jgi:hypothetical protein
MKTKEEIEQLAEKFYNKSTSNFEIYLFHIGFIDGYTQCQEDMAEKKHTCYYPLPYRLAKSDVNYECTLCGKFI